MPGVASVTCIPPEMAKAAGGWEHKRVLAVDDICDTGASFAALAHKFVELSAAAGLKDGPEVRRAAVAWKPGKMAVFKPHWWVKEYENGDWVVFPHEFTGLSEAEVQDKTAAEEEA